MVINLDQTKWLIKSSSIEPVGIEVNVEMDPIKGWVYYLNHIVLTLSDLTISELGDYLSLSIRSDKLPMLAIDMLRSASIESRVNKLSKHHWTT